MFLEDILLALSEKIVYHFQRHLYGSFLHIKISFGFQALLVIAVLFDVVFYGGNDFVVAFIVVAAVVVAAVINFDCYDFVALTAGIDVAAAYLSFADFVPAVAET